jgi:hypothetical protein
MCRRLSQDKMILNSKNRSKLIKIIKWVNEALTSIWIVKRNQGSIHQLISTNCTSKHLKFILEILKFIKLFLLFISRIFEFFVAFSVHRKVDQIGNSTEILKYSLNNWLRKEAIDVSFVIHQLEQTCERD